MKLLRPVIIFLGLLVVWQLLVSITGVAAFILPAPLSVLSALFAQWPLLLSHAGVTISEILLGLGLGMLLGCSSALVIANFRSARLWILPVLVVSQAIPVFALAPILVLWLGYGLASKVAMATLIIYFPVTVAFYDGLRRTEPGWLDLAQVMGGSRWRTLTQIRIPAALPALASGLRVAASVAPIGAIVGEWVGSSAGLGYLMLHANARLQVDVMFAALLVLALFAVCLYFSIDRGLRLLIPWQADKTL
ncbi:ABC transporter permease [Pelagibius sp. Alg239-R121]|uniref:ABC transporter permease n=1 Tax=Pelagibius sp. Alg239-R121 TaxID=2993448 RepID=UPI0024A6AF4E|nr:ABC transporter permease [Pelagibius sp. Alg239-R121]